jgi:hypothetical protein
MNNSINELAAVDLKLSDLRRPGASGQTPEFWKLVEDRVKLQREIERESYQAQLNKIAE